MIPRPQHLRTQTRSWRIGVRRWRLALVLRTALILCLTAAAVLLIALITADTPDDTRYFAAGIWSLVVLGALSSLAEYIDSSLGLGYGAIVAPMLLLAGFEPVELIPAVLISEGVSGLAASLLHHRAANVDLAPGSRDRRIAAILSLPAAAASAAAAAVAATLQVTAAEIVIGLVVVAGGAIVLARRRISGGFSWPRVGGLGLVAAGAKGISGCGFGPVAMVGQVAIGVPERDAVGIASLAEGVASLAGAAVFVAVAGWPPLRLVAALLTGGVLAIPAAVWTVRLLGPRFLRTAVGVAACSLGVLVLLSVFLA